MNFFFQKSFARLRPWIAGILLGLLVAIPFQLNIYSESKRITQRRLQEVARAIQSQFQTIEFGMQGTKGIYVTSDGKTDPTQFKKYAASRNFFDNFPIAYGFGFIRVVPKQNLAAYTEQQKKFFPHYRIRSLAQTQTDKPDYYLIESIEPYERNAAAIGLDISTEAHRLNAATAATFSGKSILSEKITLVQGGEKETGFLFFLAVYNGDSSTPSNRKENLIGWAYSAISAEKLMAAIQKNIDESLHIKIYEKSTNLQFITSNISNLSITDRESHQPDLQSEVTFGERTWVIEANEVISATFTTTELTPIFAFLLVFSIVIWISRSREKIANLNSEINQQSFQIRRLYSAIGNSAIVSETDQWGNITFANDQFCEKSGYSREELLGKNHRILNSGVHSAEFFRDFWSKITKGETWHGEICNRSKAGRVFWVESTVVPLSDEKGKIKKYLSIKFDVTEKKRVHEELKFQKEKAEILANSKTQFVASVSHELRTPLNGILGMTNFLFDTSLSEVQKQHIHTIKECGNTLLNLLNDILDVSKFELGKFELENNNFEINTVVKEINDLLKPLAEAKGLQIHAHLLNSPTWLIGDSTRIKQILTNLIGNAIKFTAKGSVTVVMEEQANSAGKKEFKVSVKDTGVGISKAGIEKLFQPFSQADSTTTRLFGGTGLGLYLCKQICERMSGRVWVESELGKGSTFAFTFACANGKAEQKSDDFEVLPSNQSLANFTLSVLLVEDNRINQLVAANLLSKLGLNSDVAGNGQEALQLLRQKKHDVVFMDCHMPVLDGFEATKQIRSNPGEYGSPHIIALSAGAMKEEVEKCFEMGMNAFLSKPAQLKDFQRVLLEFVEVHKGNLTTKPAVIKEEQKDLDPCEIFDREKFFAAFKGDEEIAAELLAEFRKQVPDILKDIEGAIQAKDAKKLELVAHTLKGSLSNFYATRSRKIAHDLEKFGSKNTLDTAPMCFDLLRNELRVLLEALEKVDRAA